jgi:fructoselysine-6-P-deglycase FrlB-like protein
VHVLEGLDWGSITPQLIPLLEIVPLQVAALALSRARGLDADQPSGLSKVTLTR